MAQIRLPEEVLREIEEDLRRDQDLWKHIHADLHKLGAPPTRARPRTRWIVVGTVASVVALFAAFALGWQAAPGASEEAAVTKIVTVAPLPGIAEGKYEALATLHGVPAAAPAPAPEPGPPGIATEKYLTIAQMLGVPQVAALPLEELQRGGKGNALEAEGIEAGSAERFRVAWNEAKAEALAS